MNPNISPIRLRVISVFQRMPVTFLFWILQWTVVMMVAAVELEAAAALAVEDVPTTERPAVTTLKLKILK